MKLIRQVRRLDYFARHISNFFPYITPHKILNLALNYFELKNTVKAPRSLPTYIKIEPTPLCQLRCPGCKHSTPEYKSTLNSKMLLSLNDLKVAIEPLKKSLLGVSLSNHGEPLLNREISEMINYLHKSNIAVSFPSNLSVKLDDAAVTDLIKSGADSIYVSLDGASEESYSKYRVGGRFDLVKENVRRLSEVKSKLGLNRPRLVWKFVIFEHNKHEVDTVRSSYKELGFDSYEMVPDRRSIYKERQKYRASKPCFWPWHTMMIDWDGQVAPCCTFADFNLGNAIKENAAEIWRSNNYQSIRLGFKDETKMHPHCKKCLGKD